ncbi:uncharacterized protein LOC106662927 isoform X2 [Cimex lectularius]|uniref:Bifunctional arginine demethylase and lysyl-hydroxylase JMJD6 n=1 Tax=Cimex lectularius TaxID=79782 RepID=A0A8I6ST54_CIMLE|nr:uncharacterized protein LOC106662927 isoform X2 [Cimex lectularius]
MAPRNLDEVSPLDLKSHLLCERFINLHSSLLKKGHRVSDLRQLARSGNARRRGVRLTWIAFVAFFIWSLRPFLDVVVKQALGVKCILPNNYFVWEATRPLADCRICQTDVLYLDNVTRKDFEPFAYSYRPIVVRDAAKWWPAASDFDYEFFRVLFEATPGAYDSVEDECQFLNFKTDLYSLRDVFQMPEERANLSAGTRPWSNCHADVLKTMRKFYEKPHFLPEDAEHSHVDFVFMGYQKGAYMHLDYISRLMWQAQLRGHKTWRLNPPPECEDICPSHTFTVKPGDIILLDTRQWYHDTYIKDELLLDELYLIYNRMEQISKGLILTLTYRPLIFPTN